MVWKKSYMGNKIEKKINVKIKTWKNCMHIARINISCGLLKKDKYLMLKQINHMYKITTKITKSGETVKTVKKIK